MSSLGVRCAAESLTYVVIAGDLSNPEVVEHGVIPMPKGSRSEQLAWLRREIREIIARTSVTSVAFKAAEGSAQNKDLSRAEAEGVVQEACESAQVRVLRRVKSQMRTDLGWSEPARYIDRALPKHLAELPKNRHEAALASMSALANA